MKIIHFVSEPKLNIKVTLVNTTNINQYCSVGWFVSLLVREEVLLANLCEKKILFRLEIYDRLRQAIAKRTG